MTKMFGPKKCMTCGVIVEKATAIKKVGKYFCSEEHAEIFVREDRKRRNKEGSGCHCCG